MSEEARDELTRPLRVESGRTSSPGEGPSQWQPDHRDLRQGGPRLPEPGEEPAEGGGEPRTIERPRGRARVLDRRELAPLPGEGRHGDPMPPPSSEESGTGSPSVMATESDREDETVAGPRLKKARRGGRAPRPSDDHRKANKRKNSEERGASSGVRMRTSREEALGGDVV